jgi:Zn-dependent peptidase ImmA (M78 family)
VNRPAYYEELKALARQVRREHHLGTPRVLRSDLRRLYRAYGIQIDLWPHKFRALRGAYFDDELGPTVMLARQLPPEPLIFTMAHELKHHLVDRGRGLAYCAATNEREPLEIGAEIFAAELIFPEQDFVAALLALGVGRRH